jgi:magnesium chelatase family protein
VNVQAVDYTTIKDTRVMQPDSAALYKAVECAVACQRKRFGNVTIYNSQMGSDMIETYCLLTPTAEQVLKKAFDVLRLSMRGYHKILKIARTIADMQAHEYIDVADIQEALMYRSLDKATADNR